MKLYQLLTVDYRQTVRDQGVDVGFVAMRRGKTALHPGRSSRAGSGGRLCSGGEVRRFSAAAAATWKKPGRKGGFKLERGTRFTTNIGKAGIKLCGNQASGYLDFHDNEPGFFANAPFLRQAKFLAG